MQHTAVNPVTTFWAPLNSWKFIRSYIIALNPFCCHCGRCSYVSYIRFLTCSSPAESCRPLYVSIAMAEKKITLDEEAISEILVADTTLNQVLRLAILKTILKRRKKKRINNNTTTTTTTTNSKPQQKSKHRLQRVVDYQPGTASRKEHKYSSFCRSSERCEKSEAPHINKDSSPLSVLMFFTEIFHLLVEQTNMYYQQQLDRQARPSRQLPDITVPDMMTFVALALQMGHKLKDTLHDYQSRLRQLHNPFYGKTMP